MIAFKRESFDSIYEDIKPLWDNHYQEIALDQESIELNPHIEGYKEFEKLGGLYIFSLRDEGKLIGYAFFFLQYSMHYRQLICAVNDLFYIVPEYRGRWLGSKFLKEIEKDLSELGVHQVQMRTKVYASFGPILERNGYKEVEVAYRKNINVPHKLGD